MEADERKVPERSEHVGLVVVVTLGVGELLLAPALLVQVGDDTGLVHERLEEVEHAQRGPYVVAALERRELLLGLDGELAAVLAHGLELVDELVDHLPEPQVGELHVDVTVKDHAEQVAVVLPALLALIERGRGLAVHVAEVHLLVQQAKDVIVVGVPRDRLGAGPGGGLEVALGDGGEGLLVHGKNLVHCRVEGKGARDQRGGWVGENQGLKRFAGRRRWRARSRSSRGCIGRNRHAPFFSRMWR